MPDVDEFQPGLPSWADLATKDADESVSFYGELLGWEADEPNDDFGGYRNFRKDDKLVAGLAPAQEGQPPSWNIYISVSDADETAEKVGEAGGEVKVEPMDVGDLGRMAVFTDPTGAYFGIWQAKEHKGADVVSEPGYVAWHQVNTRDPEEAEEFYKAVFGWESDKIDTGGADYWEWQQDGKSVGGMFRMGDDFPEDVPAHWIVYFAVEDADAATEKAKEGGAEVRAEPFDNEAGRFSVLTDPHGAAFALINQGGGSVAGAEDEEDEQDSGQKDSGQDEGQDGEQDEDDEGDDDEDADDNDADDKDDDDS
jgi:predicted enzyme related to lactoylglutathione lyase